jgi:UTP--glucose-1-phosphate uridylyltransferase
MKPVQNESAGVYAVGGYSASLDNSLSASDNEGNYDEDIHLGSHKGVFDYDALSHSEQTKIEMLIEDMAELPKLTQRSKSMSKFVQDATNAATNSMQQELAKLTNCISDSVEKAKFKDSMDVFNRLFTRFLQQKAEGPIDWSRVRNLADEHLIKYQDLDGLMARISKEPRISFKEMLQSLVVVKLNGGLGTTMGCVGPKSAIEVRDGMTFLDLTVRQIEWLNQVNDVDVPLILMNSFNTDSETKQIIKKYAHHRITILTFNQHKFPRIGKDSLLPIPTHPNDDQKYWYPPGHGDIFDSLHSSGLLDSLLNQGKTHLFVSNIDNLGATVDESILSYLHATQIEFLMEVTNKTKADIKGGTLIQYLGTNTDALSTESTIRLLEVAQVPSEHMKDFTSIKKFKVFNTNNVWLRLSALKRVIEAKSLALEVIVNVKSMEDTGNNSSGDSSFHHPQKVIQLETAIGSAIRYFTHATGVVVPRSRFLPVKSCSDLFLVQSDLYSLEHGVLTISPKRPFGSIIPLVKLGDHFKKVQSYLARFSGPPHILELDHLTVSGDVTFGSDVTLKGTVIIVANHGSHIDIPSGAILHDKVVSGNLRILDH